MNLFIVTVDKLGTTGYRKEFAVLAETLSGAADLALLEMNTRDAPVGKNWAVVSAEMTGVEVLVAK